MQHSVLSQTVCSRSFAVSACLHRIFTCNRYRDACRSSPEDKLHRIVCRQVARLGCRFSEAIACCACCGTNSNEARQPLLLRRSISCCPSLASDDSVLECLHQSAALTAIGSAAASSKHAIICSKSSVVAAAATSCTPLAQHHNRETTVLRALLH